MNAEVKPRIETSRTYWNGNGMFEECIECPTVLSIIQTDVAERFPNMERFLLAAVACYIHQPVGERLYGPDEVVDYASHVGLPMKVVVENNVKCPAIVKRKRIHPETF